MVSSCPSDILLNIRSAALSTVSRHVSAAKAFRGLAQEELCLEQGEVVPQRFSAVLAFTSTSPQEKSSPASLGFPASR